MALLRHAGIKKKEKYRMEYIDMHSHILPGLDDGSKNMEMTLAMLRVAVEEGIGTIYTTPLTLRSIMTFPLMALDCFAICSRCRH